MLTYRHPLSRDLMALISSKIWEKDTGAEEIVAHLYDYLNGLVIDLEEEGLPIGTCHEATVAALIDVCAVSMGKVETNALISRLLVKMLLDPELHV